MTSMTQVTRQKSARGHCNAVVTWDTAIGSDRPREDHFPATSVSVFCRSVMAALASVEPEMQL